MQVSHYLYDWLNSESPLLRRSTYEAYTVYICRHIIPYFEQLGVTLKELHPIQIQQYVNEKLRGGRLDGKPGGLGLVTVKKHLSVIKQALKDAVLYGYITTNPALSVKLPRNTGTLTKRTVFLEAGDAQRMVTALQAEPTMQLAVLLALLYGLRRSEVLGLRWQSIDFTRGTITIEHTVVKNLTIQAADATKTESSMAAYQLLPEVRTALLRHFESTRGFGSSYVFTRSDGTVMRPDCLTRSFKRCLARHGFPPMRFHDLRHSTASILFARGWSLEDVKNWLRHTDIETTSNIYLHYQKSRRVLVAHDLAGMFTV